MLDTQTNNGYVAVIFILFKLSLVAKVGHVTNTNPFEVYTRVEVGCSEGLFLINTSSRMLFY